MSFPAVWKTCWTRCQTVHCRAVRSGRASAPLGGGVQPAEDAGQAGEVYNVSGGVGVSIADIVDALRRLAAKPFDVIQDPALMRPLDQKVKVGDNSKLMALGWKPSLALEESLRTILDHWSRKA